MTTRFIFLNILAGEQVPATGMVSDVTPKDEGKSHVSGENGGSYLRNVVVVR